MEKKQSEEKQFCFMCGRGYYPDDPEFNPKYMLCDNCAEELDADNPYNYLPLE